MAAAMRAVRPSCPFCQFAVKTDNEDDMYILMHHLELSHPENGYSPFMVQDMGRTGCRSRSRSSRGSTSSQKEGTTASRSRSHTPSVDGDEDIYVDCPVGCGEAVHMRELQDHMDLHEIENQALDISQRHQDQAASAQSPPEDESIDIKAGAGKGGLNRQAETLLSVPRAHQSRKKTQDSPKHRRFKGLFLGPAPRKIRSSQAAPKLGNAKRLGVNWPITN